MLNQKPPSELNAYSCEGAKRLLTGQMCSVKVKELYDSQDAE